MTGGARAGSTGPAWSLAVLIPVGLLAWVLFASPLLVVRAVEVTGTRQVPADAVVAAVAVPRGTPLAQVDVGAVRSRVARARTGRRGPGHPGLAEHAAGAGDRAHPCRERPGP